MYLIDFAHFWKKNCQVFAQLVQYLFCSKNFAVLCFGIDSDKKVFERYFAGRIWTENAMDFLKSRNCEIFSECGRDSDMRPHTGKQLKGSFCQQNHTNYNTQKNITLNATKLVYKPPNKKIITVLK